jgi:hypothetical protein
MAEESLALIGNASGRVVAGDRSALLLPRLAGSWWIVANSSVANSSVTLKATYTVSRISTDSFKSI